MTCPECACFEKSHNPLVLLDLYVVIGFCVAVDLAYWQNYSEARSCGDCERSWSTGYVLLNPQTH